MRNPFIINDLFFFGHMTMTFLWFILPIKWYFLAFCKGEKKLVQRVQVFSKSYTTMGKLL